MAHPTGSRPFANLPLALPRAPGARRPPFWTFTRVRYLLIFRHAGIPVTQHFDDMAHLLFERL